MKNVEIWLCKVLLHPMTQKPMRQQELKLEEHQLIIGKIISGDIGSLPDGTIVEPLSAHKTEPDANAAREKAKHDDPRGDYRVVMTAEV